MSFTLAMPPERYRETVTTLTELKDMRNELVHHLLEKFDISTEVGCLAASRYLEGCYEKVDGAIIELKQWADAHDEAVRFMRESLELEEVRNAFVQGNPLDRML